MKTAGWFTYFGPGRIGISRGIPRNAKPGFASYRVLAPGSWFNSVTPEEYVTLFSEKLDQLDPHGIWQRLHELAGDHEPVLLCWERPPFHRGNWCHRRMVAEWLEQHVGAKIPEMGYDAPPVAETLRLTPPGESGRLL